MTMGCCELDGCGVGGVGGVCGDDVGGVGGVGIVVAYGAVCWIWLGVVR